MILFFSPPRLWQLPGLFWSVFLFSLRERFAQARRIRAVRRLPIPKLPGER